MLRGIKKGFLFLLFIFFFLLKRRKEKRKLVVWREKKSRSRKKKKEGKKCKVEHKFAWRIELVVSVHLTCLLNPPSHPSCWFLHLPNVFPISMQITIHILRSISFVPPFFFPAENLSVCVFFFNHSSVFMSAYLPFFLYLFLTHSLFHFNLYHVTDLNYKTIK